MPASIARKWHDLLLGTEPVDHARAEAAVRAAYGAAGLAEPAQFLWCASPLEAIWAVLVLIGDGESYNVPLLDNVRRKGGGKDKLAALRAGVAARLGISADEVEGRFGPPFYSADRQPVAHRLAGERMWAWLAAAEAGRGWQVGQAGPFEELDRLEHALFREGHEGGLMYAAAARAGAKAIAWLVQRSAQHRLYGTLAYGEIARDEALAARGAGEPTEMQSAFQAAYEACGMWWPLEAGVVLAERPRLAEGSGGSLRMEWTDGFTLGAAGSPAASARPEWQQQAEPVRRAPILDSALPRDHGERIAVLRAASGGLPFLDRYLAGDHEQVWKELVALGPDALSERHAADALAVACETMSRVEANLRLLTGRLDGLGYRFRPLGSSEGLLSRLFGSGASAPPRPRIEPAVDVSESIAEMERAADGPIPLSLRAFYEIVGSVDFSGEHEALAPRDGRVMPDPLFVYGARDGADSLEEYDDDLLTTCIAPDALHKANVSGGEAYSIALPAPAADAPLDDEPHGVTFVEYLRIAILRWGGFPGWEEADEPPPPELDSLREGLIPF